jgi:Cu(I)/Ag(I) efflux system membrane fusion protein
VFRDLGEGRLEPRNVVLGPGSGGPDGFVEVLEGLEEGDIVVTSGTFLVAAESRLKAAEELWR